MRARTLARWFVVALVALPLALLAALALGSSPAAAQQGVATLRSTHAAVFPRELVFRLDASSDRRLTRSGLYYRVGEGPSTVYVNVPIRGDRAIVAEHRVNLQRRYIPPGAEIRYYWSVEDDQGRVTRGQVVQMQLQDSRFSWNRVNAGPIHVYWYAGGQEFGQAVAGYALQTFNRLTQDVGFRPERPISIFLYGSLDDFRGGLTPAAQNWTGGLAFARERVILVPAPPNQDGVEVARRSIPHEISHVLVHLATDNPYGDIPHWLSEGLAQRAEGTVDEGMVARVLQAQRENRLISVRALGSSFPPDEEQALLSYAQSESLVRFILEEHGRESMARLLATFREGATYDEAVQRALNVTIDELDGRWRASLGANPLLKATPFAEQPPPAPPQPLTPAALVERAGRAIGDLLASIRSLLGG